MPRTVLIVDDERDTNDILADLVRARDFVPIQLLSGATVVDAVKTQNPDLVLLDVMLPDIDGFAVCERLKRERETNLVPVVIVTALNDPSHRLQGIRVGANAYLAKPFTPEALFKTIDEVLAWRDEHETHGTKGEIHFDIPSELAYLQQLNDMLTDLYAHTPLTERQVKDLRQVVMEMGGNAIEWGNRKDPGKLVKLIYRITPTHVSVIIRDEGPGFNPGNLPHAASDEDPIGHLDVRNEAGIREGGFGIMLTKGLVDSFQYNEKGNQVTLVKKFDHPMAN